MQTLNRRAPATVAIILTAVLGGCAAAAGAAGAAGAIAYTERGASSETAASVDVVTAAAEAAFADLGITVTDREVEGTAEVELEGRRGDMEIAVEIDRGGDGLTAIEVIAKEGVVQYDRDYAHTVLERILSQL